MTAYQDAYPLNMRASSVIGRGEFYQFMEHDDDSAAWNAETEPFPEQERELFEPRNPEIDAMFCRLFHDVDREIAECQRRGTPLAYALKRQNVRKQRIQRNPRAGLSNRSVVAPCVEEEFQTASAVVNWADTPHGVNITRKAFGPVTAFDDTALRLAYETAQWRKRAERFHVPLEMADAEVHSALRSIQELSRTAARSRFE